ncbi:hypothetical protein CRG98_009522 [Punica granatum]|uniref:Uncharacterized protein n=1 Tax=Punica granatum TaxID=22663 RepID=A0A2I0KNP6_PUNGR|nr:hypothetical protein CRG98_009522 [Punica granatum]
MATTSGVIRKADFVGEAHLAELEAAWKRDTFLREGDRNMANRNSNARASIHCSGSEKVTLTTSQETYEMLTDPTETKIWREVIEKKKGCSYGLIDLPFRPNCHEAGPFGTASRVNPAMSEQFEMLKGLIFKLAKKVDKVT